jgi:hypothetical protein
MEAYLQAMLDHRDISAVLLLEHRSLEPELRLRHIPRRDRFERVWRDLIEEGVSQEIFTCPDPAMASRALLGVMNWTITWYRPDGTQSPGTIANHFTDLFLNGLMVR